MYKFILLITVFISSYSCRNESINKLQENIKQNTKQLNIESGRKLKLLTHVLTLHNTSVVDSTVLNKSDYKLISYIEINCQPCWESSLVWKDRYYSFKDKFPKVPVLIIIHGTEQQFNIENKKAKFSFPVFLDKSERFRKVNHIGYIAEEMTFLIDSTNKVVLTGRPFTDEMIGKYDAIINKGQLTSSR